MMNLFAIIAALLTGLIPLSPFLVEGPSMLPTLHDGDLFILDSRAYEESEPARGDIVVFSDEKDKEYYYVKRVVGLPGERLHVTDNGILVEREGINMELPEPYLAHAAEDKNYALNGFKDEVFLVPADKYFVLGDNRAHSLDSRSFAYPFIPKTLIKGKYLFTLIDL
jgi:signal peptidase I